MNVLVSQILFCKSIKLYISVMNGRLKVDNKIFVDICRHL